MGWSLSLHNRNGCTSEEKKHKASLVLKFFSLFPFPHLGQHGLKNVHNFDQNGALAFVVEYFPQPFLILLFDQTKISRFVLVAKLNFLVVLFFFCFVWKVGHEFLFELAEARAMHF